MITKPFMVKLFLCKLIKVTECKMVPTRVV